MLSWSGKFLRVLSPSGWREIFNKLILSALEWEEIQEGKAHLLSRSILMAFLKTCQFCPKPLAGRNHGECACCWPCVPWIIFPHCKPKACRKAGSVMYFKPQVALDSKRITQNTTEDGISGSISARIDAVAVFPFHVCWKWFKGIENLWVQCPLTGSWQLSSL